MKTVFITGGSSDIGSGIASLFESKGWRVISPSRQQLDLNNLDQLAKSLKKILSNTDKLDAVIHVAGVWHDKDEVYAGKPLQKFSPDQIIQTINVGLTSFAVLAAILLPQITKSGSVIAVTGTFVDGGAGWLPYFTSKRALEDFLVGLSQDYPDGPNIFGVSPADTATEAYLKFYPEYADEAQPVGNVSRLCFDLAEGNINSKTGDILEVRGGEIRNSFHA